MLKKKVVNYRFFFNNLKATSAITKTKLLTAMWLATCDDDDDELHNYNIKHTQGI